MSENVRKTRIKQWIIWIIIALICLGVEALCTNVIFKEKEPFYVCAPEDMKDAFKTALKVADMNSDYKIVMTDDPKKANVYVYYGDECDVNFSLPNARTKFAFSPFVVAYSYEYDKAFLKSKLIEKNASFDNLYDISLTNLIDAVLSEENWASYGVNGFKKIKVAYPDPSTIYWKDFYNLMLIAANYGKYPVESSEYNRAINRLNRFFASDNTEAIVDFNEKVYLSGGFTKDILYIGPEKLFIGLYSDVSIFAPTETVHFNYYLIVDKLGMGILSGLDKETYWTYSSFYKELNKNSYRNKNYVEINFNSSNSGNWRWLKGSRNVFNIVPISEKVNWKVEAEE